ncbi:hypothetical protein FOMPIDRAFT_1134770 [Fomitopsis schrenkii]|uniref:Uncharacterized protein n=1 Tax=Fomitopsis schrenkii TaxID=2126942 RepID=S8F5R3_FOMSC|nr:hypothetical protein FOMPIDRAFT_1134770 [Fomitopsis schrenkii]
MWTKRYLTLDERRPMWALAADVLLSRAASRDAGAIRPLAQMNSFLQSWTPAVHKASPLPEYLKRMLSTAKKYNVSFAAVKLDHSMKVKLPIWYHLGATKKLRRMNNTKTGDCLRLNHGVRTVADVLRVTNRDCYRDARESRNDYVPEDCACPQCEEDRRQGCKHPRKCCRAADRALEEVRPKWHPDEPLPQDGLSLTQRRHDANADALESDGTLTFDPSLTERGDLDIAFRAFVDPRIHDEPPAVRRATGRVVTAEACTMYIVGQPGEGAPAGTGFASCERGGIRSPLVQPTIDSERDAPESGTVVATLGAVLAAPRDAPLHLVLGTKHLIAALFQHLHEWEDEGWIGVKGAAYLKALVNQLRQRSAPTTFRMAKGEDDDMGMAAA